MIIECASEPFSEADDQIYRVAKKMAGAGPGNASMWREWNTIHHITRVVRDLGAMADVEFALGRITIEPEQHLLFEDVEEQ